MRLNHIQFSSRISSATPSPQAPFSNSAPTMMFDSQSGSGEMASMRTTLATPWAFHWW